MMSHALPMMSHAFPYDVTRSPYDIICPSPQITYLFYGTIARVNPFRIETRAGGVAIIYTSSLLGSYDGTTFNLPVCACVVCVDVCVGVCSIIVHICIS